MAEYLIPFAVRTLDPDAEIPHPVYDERGLPQVLPDHRFVVETVTLRQCMARLGVDEYFDS